MTDRYHGNDLAARVVLADSITHVSATGPGALVVICGSHGGFSAAVYAVHARVKGAIFNDAGIGKENAGISGLTLLEQYGILAAAVDAFTAKIGMASETETGIISHANAPARRAGVRNGMPAGDAARVMAAVDIEPLPAAVPDLDIKEERAVVHTDPAGFRIVTLDSNAMVAEDNRWDVVMTGSHGGLVGAQPAVKYPVVGAFYNDAGVGKDNAGISRLPWLQQHGIAGATVDAFSARIGIGRDTFRTGIVSQVNETAEAAGIRIGMHARGAAKRIIAAMDPKPRPPG
jgi:hypothetical protein